MAYSTPFSQSFPSPSSMYLKSGGMGSMPYHMGLGSLGMGLDPMHAVQYGNPSKFQFQYRSFQRKNRPKTFKNARIIRKVRKVTENVLYFYFFPKKTDYTD